MKTTIITIFVLSAIRANLYGQDGSDIQYFKVQDIDSTFIGREVHFDFVNRSFRGRPLDTIRIIVHGKPIRFVEVRKDNGYDNWFSQQGLRSVGRSNGMTIRITKFRLNRTTAAAFQVTMFLDYYDTDNKILANKSEQIEYWFDKKDIIEVLVKSEQ